MLLRPVMRSRVGVVVTRVPVVRVSRMRTGFRVVIIPELEGGGVGGDSRSSVQGVVMTRRMDPHEPSQPSTATR